jgi:hypothetical protein
MNGKALRAALTNPRLLAAPTLPAWYVWWALEYRFTGKARRRRSDGEGGLTPVRRVSGWTVDDAIAAREPVVLTDVVSRWPALDRWSPDYIKSVNGAQQVFTLVSSADVRDFGEGNENREEFIPLSRLIELVFDTPAGNDRYYSVGSALGQLQEDIVVPPSAAYSSSGESPPALWVGQDGNLTPLHYDLFHGFLAQIRGKKRAILFPPEESSLLEPTSPFGGRMCQTALPPNCLEADPVRHPTFRRARGYQVTIEPGELLHIPLHWWHQVELVGPNLSLTLRYDPDWKSLIHPGTFPLAFRETIGRVLRALKSPGTDNPE